MSDNVNTNKTTDATQANNNQTSDTALCMAKICFPFGMNIAQQASSMSGRELANMAFPLVDPLDVLAGAPANQLYKNNKPEVKALAKKVENQVKAAPDTANKLANDQIDLSKNGTKLMIDVGAQVAKGPIVQADKASNGQLAPIVNPLAKTIDATAQGMKKGVNEGAKFGHEAIDKGTGVIKTTGQVIGSVAGKAYDLVPSKDQLKFW